MPELLRHLAGHLRALVANRRASPRKQLRLRCAVSLHDTRPDAAARRAPSLEVYTRDLSSTGIALVAPAIRINDRYLTDATLRLLLEHPAGSMEIVAQPVRYEQLPPEGEETGYLIGVRITSMSDADRTRYDEHLSALD
jgi:hypothetical protein